jgi:hypothetical protein
MFEHKSEPVLPKSKYVRRQWQYALIAVGMILASWGIGTAGYMSFEGMGLVDGLTNAAMILGGMGPMGELHTTGGKLFAAFYALFSGIGFIGAAGVLFAPAYHRFLHNFHIEEVARKRPASKE